jgi:hypothetical protein
MFGAIKYFATFNNHPIKISAIFEEKTMLRKILAVIAGYMVFAISSVLLFTLSGHHPHQDAPFNFQLSNNSLRCFLFHPGRGGGTTHREAKEPYLKLYIVFYDVRAGGYVHGPIRWQPLDAVVSHVCFRTGFYCGWIYSK